MAMMADVTMTVEDGTLDTHNEDEWKRTAYHWDVTLHRDGRTHHVNYWMGVGLVERRPANGRQTAPKGWDFEYGSGGPKTDVFTRPLTPDLHDVLSSLSTDCSCADQSFEDFCGDFGYDTDSRKAYRTWEECRNQMFRLARFFGPDFDEFMSTEWEEMDAETVK